MLDPKLLEILACPVCKEPVVPTSDHGHLVCQKCRVKYRVEDDIPIMLVDEAETLVDETEPRGNETGSLAEED